MEQLPSKTYIIPDAYMEAFLVNERLKKDLEGLLEKYAIVAVLSGLAEIMQRPGGDSEKLVAVGKCVEDLTAQVLWD